MNSKATRFLDQFIKEHNENDGYSEELDQLFSDYVTENFSTLLVEDHEKRMTAKEMASHIKKLFKMCEDEETEKKFLKALGKAASVDDCSESDIKKCADSLCKEDEEKCDDVIHKLEGMVGYESEDNDSDDDDDDSDDDKDKKKEKVNESKKGAVVKKGKSKYVVLQNLGDGDVRVAKIHHGKPLYRNTTMINSGNYEDTGERMNVQEPERSPTDSDKAGGYDEHTAHA